MHISTDIRVIMEFTIEFYGGRADAGGSRVAESAVELLKKTDYKYRGCMGFDHKDISHIPNFQ